MIKTFWDTNLNSGILTIWIFSFSEVILNYIYTNNGNRPGIKTTLKSQSLYIIGESRLLHFAIFVLFFCHDKNFTNYSQIYFVLLIPQSGSDCITDLFCFKFICPFWIFEGFQTLLNRNPALCNKSQFFYVCHFKPNRSRKSLFSVIS